MDAWNVANVTSIISVVFAGLAVLVAYIMWQSNSQAQTKKDGEWKGEVTSSLKNLDGRLSHVEQQISNVYKFFLNIFKPETTVQKSPIRLNELGKFVSEDIKAKAWVDKVSDALKKEIEDKDAYEIQVFCFEYVETPDLYSDKEQHVIRDSAYKRGISAFDVRRVFAIELRDKLLEYVGLEASEH